MTHKSELELTEKKSAEYRREGTGQEHGDKQKDTHRHRRPIACALLKQR